MPPLLLQEQIDGPSTHSFQFTSVSAIYLNCLYVGCSLVPGRNVGRLSCFVFRNTAVRTWSPEPSLIPTLIHPPAPLYIPPKSVELMDPLNFLTPLPYYLFRATFVHLLQKLAIPSFYFPFRTETTLGTKWFSTSPTIHLYPCAEIHFYPFNIDC